MRVSLTEEDFNSVKNFKRDKRMSATVKSKDQKSIVTFAFVTFTFSQRVKELRKYLGFTQKQFADKIGCSQQYVGFIETNRTTPS